MAGVTRPTAGRVENQSIVDSTVQPVKLDPVHFDRYIHDRFSDGVSSYSRLLGYGNPTGVAADLNAFRSGPYVHEYFIIGTQTLLGPVVIAGGLDTTLDLTSTDGLEIGFGGGLITNANARCAFTVGVRGFYGKLVVKEADISGVNPGLFMARKQEAAYQAAYTSYTDYFGIGVVTAANPGAIKIVQRINTGTAVITDTTNTWADTVEQTYEIRVSRAGKATATYGASGGGVVPTVNVRNHTFDDGDVIGFAWHRECAATSPGAERLALFECGYLPDQGGWINRR